MEKSQGTPQLLTLLCSYPTVCPPRPVQKPKVHVLHSSCSAKSGDTINLVCFITGFYPKPLMVEWLVDGSTQYITHTTDDPKKDDDSYTFHTISKASISQDEWLEGKTYTCKVSHVGATVEAYARKCSGIVQQGWAG